jgi:NADPH2:quinone reductase
MPRGGVGLIACQWAKALGAKLIGTVGNAQKAQRAAGGRLAGD